MTHGLVLGKFLPYHKGHAHLIRTARAQVELLTVLVCSIGREPIPGGQRFQWVRSSHLDCRVLHVSEEVPQSPDEDSAFWPVWIDLIRRHVGRVDTVFTSEPYGDELAARMGARHVSVDPGRTIVPTSGTAIRADPLRQWPYIPTVVRPYFVRRVAILGTESSGKTTLAQQLAQRFETVWVPEYGRAYCDERAADTLTASDFEAIVWGQATWEAEAAPTANRVMISDTELHTTCTWSDLIVGSHPRWMSDVAQSQRYDLMLLLESDVPWIDDGTRVLGLRRAEHTSRLRRALEEAGRAYTVVRGTYAQRFAIACRAMEGLLASSETGTISDAAR